MNLKSLIKKHESFITCSPRLYFSPGRVNLIGEHIDYLGGHVFPTAIDLGTYALVSSREDNDFHFLSENFLEKGKIVVNPKDLDYRNEDDWVNYCKGMMQALGVDKLKDIHGLNILIYGDLPNGAGLSSSASLEVLMGVILRDEFNLKIQVKSLEVVEDQEAMIEENTISKTEREMKILVQIAQKVENEYIGVNCGIMDQFAVGMSQHHSALYLNANTLDFERVPLILGEYSLIIANTNKRRELSTTKYNERRKECDLALKQLQKDGWKIKNLCDIPKDDLAKALMSLDMFLWPRVTHAVFENLRVAQAVEVLRKGDLIEFGNLMSLSHDSLKIEFEVSCFELDVLVEAFLNNGAIGARMTGGGFGGCVIALIPSAKRDSILEKVGKRYKKAVGYAADFYPVNTHDGTARSNKLLYIRISDLVNYSIVNNMCKIEDRDYVINRLLAELHMNEYEDACEHSDLPESISEILDPLLDHAFARGCFAPNTVKERDIFEACLMNIFMPRPSELNETFTTLYATAPELATQYFYKLSHDSNYIKNVRIAKNITWRSETKYGMFDMSINLSKPEKDPRDIIASGQKKSTDYPKCLLCKENVGYEGHASHPGRANHRIVPVELNKEQFYLQYSPYVYYNEHCIVLKDEHVPMVINEASFRRLLDFVDQFPHYFLGSNADLPIVGGSILSHEHYQGGSHTFAMNNAKEVSKLKAKVELGENHSYELSISKLFWPLSVIRLESKNKDALIKSARVMLNLWREYSDESVGIFSHSDNTPHNTITPIARKVGDLYQLDMTLRNNRCSKEHPLGIFHPHAEQHHIKKENIGLIEVMGLAILPARLEKELGELEDCLKNGESLPADLDHHKTWFADLKSRYQGTDMKEFIRKEVTLKFVQCLEDAGVYKQNEVGQAAFDKFIDHYIVALKGELS